MSRTFFTADWHLGDPRVDILSRPFSSTDEMTERIIAEHNAIVSPEDTVFVIGDALYAGADESMVSQLARFNGQLVLLRGNQDVLPDEAYAPYVRAVVPEGQGIELPVAGVSCWLNHYPTQSRPDVDLNLVGHIHGQWRIQKAMLNCGVDVHHFRPVSAEQVAFYLTAITDYYDQDVWVADHPANVAHAERGKPGTYFPR